MKKNILKLGCLAVCLLLSSCNSTNEKMILKTKFKDYFPIGATLNYSGVKNNVFSDLIEIIL